jgi:predicted ABC-type ATPase
VPTDATASLPGSAGFAFDLSMVAECADLAAERVTETVRRGGHVVDEVQGLVAQGRTIQETLEIARDVAKKLLEAPVA